VTLPVFEAGLSRRNCLICAAAAFCGSSPARAQLLAPAPIWRFIMPLPYSGGWPRLAAQRVMSELSQPSVIEDRFGANGQIAMRHMIEQAPERQNVLVSSASTSTLNFITRTNFGHDRRQHFRSAGKLFRLPMALVTRPGGPSTFGAFLDDALRHPGRLNYTSAGVGSLPHLIATMMSYALGIQAQHVPQNGSSLMQVMGGHADFAIVNFDSILPQLNAGRFQLLAITSDRRSELIPEVPVLKEFEKSLVAWSPTSLLLRRDAPDADVESINQAINRVLSQPQWRETAKSFGAFLPRPHTPAEDEAWLDEDDARWRDVVQRSGMVLTRS
jgi:tripartite-type tricarboxylate transporter receptor subunit TctC